MASYHTLPAGNALPVFPAFNYYSSGTISFKHNQIVFSLVHGQQHLLLAVDAYPHNDGFDIGTQAIIVDEQNTRIATGIVMQLLPAQLQGLQQHIQQAQLFEQSKQQQVKEWQEVMRESCWV